MLDSETRDGGIVSRSCFYSFFFLVENWNIRLFNRFAFHI